MPTNDYVPGRPELGLTDDGALTLDYPDGRLVVLSLEPNGQTTTYTAIGRHMGPERVPAMLVSTAKYRELKAELERRAGWMAAHDAKIHATAGKLEAERQAHDATREELEGAKRAARERAMMCGELHDREQALQAKLAERNAELEGLTARNRDLVDDVDMAQAAALTTADKLEDSEQELERQAAHIADLERQLADMTRAHHGEATAADRHKAERDEALAKLKESERIRATVLGSLRETGKASAELVEANVRTRRELEAAREELEELKRETETVPVGYHGSRERPSRYDHAGADVSPLPVGEGVRLEWKHDPYVGRVGYGVAVEGDEGVRVVDPSVTFRPDYVSLWDDYEGGNSRPYAAGPRDVRRPASVKTTAGGAILFDRPPAPGRPYFVFDPSTGQYLVKDDPSDTYSI